jgi:2-methylisocitrate lyase-like PEP mutase family enzyme
MSQTTRLRELLAADDIIIMPGCYDCMSARLIERAGFKAAFMSGFTVAASRIGMPDTGLISYAEMVDQGTNICSAVSIPVIGDGDTGYGNALNVQRTVRGYERAGFACVMIEDQVAPARASSPRSASTSRSWKRPSTRSRCAPIATASRVPRWPTWSSRATRPC